jgi:predicted O-linked N-acetylglucosamine transferase (SPINDLY family)
VQILTEPRLRSDHRIAGSTEPGRVGPRVSVLLFCKDAIGSVQRSIDSVLNQTYPNIEYVVQDGASTDGTLELLQRYGDRIALESRRDSGPAEAFLLALRRCRGDIIGACLADEEYLPDTIERVVERFVRNPRVAAITGDAWVTDLQGRVTGTFEGAEFSLADYLFGRYCPYFSSSFFRREALATSGLYDDTWHVGCLEFEMWVRLATEHEIQYWPEKLSKYAQHPGQLSHRTTNVMEQVRGRFDVIERLFSEDGFFGVEPLMREECLVRQASLFYGHLMAMGRSQAAAAVVEEIRKRIGTSFVPVIDVLVLYEALRRVWSHLRPWVPARLRASTSPETKARIKARVRAAARLLARGNARLRGALGRRTRWTDYISQPVPALVYQRAAACYESRGQIDAAVRTWGLLGQRSDRHVDSLACQALLKSPSVTNQELLEAQLRWASRHALPGKPGPARAPSVVRTGVSRPIHVGYHCSSWQADYMRYQVLPFVRLHDRDAFRVFGFSSTSEQTSATACFDGFDCVGSQSDADFRRTVRGREIDVLVELTGFSPFHRFSALAERCAPVQVSYINHTGTSGVLNVDYVLADSIAAPPHLDRYYTETIYRLPGSFFCFDYRGARAPEVADPPLLRNGYPTFGCFGSASKINERIVELWAQVLQAVPEARLLVRNAGLSSPANRAFLLQQLQFFGAPPSRVRLLGGTDRDTILGNYSEVDISLDTWPHCGGNTIAESVWQGVPVVTLLGERFSMCYGASILHACGLGSLVADTPESYVAIAGRLAADPERLSSYRKDLRRMVVAHGFSDSQRFVRGLEDAYREMLGLPKRNSDAAA